MSNIQDKIFTIRDIQVMLDHDLARLYGVTTKRLNEQVKRNIKRFPSEFMFRLIDKEKHELVANCDRLQTLKHSTANPRVFTESGVVMLASVLRSQIAINVSIEIVKAFIGMRKLLINSAGIFQRLEHVEIKQVKTDKSVQKILSALDDQTLQPKQGIFYDGQIFDAYRLARKIVRSAKSSIILIDNYVNEDTLYTLSDRKLAVTCDIYTSRITKKLELDLAKYNQQHSPITIHQFDRSHDRFLIIDQKDVYHFGASIKDLGKKWFACTRFDSQALSLIDNLDTTILKQDTPSPTPFATRVYLALESIPIGRVTTYKNLAHKIGSRAYQAVGTALANNPYAPTVPCHRVVATDGTIGGFMGNKTGESINRKIKLLESEGVLVRGGKILNFSDIVV